MATSRQYIVGLDEEGIVGSKTTRIHPPGGLSHINHEMMPESADAKNFSRVLKPPGGGSSSADSVFSDGSSMASMTSSPNESRASSTSPKTPAKKYHMRSNFELGDEQPDKPTVNTPPKRKNTKPSIDPLTGEVLGQRTTPMAQRIDGCLPQLPNTATKPAQRIPPGGFSTPLW